MASFFIASRQVTTGTARGMTETGLTVFAAIGVAGLAGSVAASRLADRIGRAATPAAP